MTSFIVRVRAGAHRNEKSRSGRPARHCPPGCPDKNLITFLKSLDDDIQNSLDPMFKAQGTEVASAFGEQVNEFIKHVGRLAGDKGHLYSAY